MGFKTKARVSNQEVFALDWVDCEYQSEKVRFPSVYYFWKAQLIHSSYGL